IDEIGTKIVMTISIQKERNLSVFLFQGGLFLNLVVNYKYTVPMKTFAPDLYLYDIPMISPLGGLFFQRRKTLKTPL
ncbi:MAG: hypothetical protein ACXVBH_15405, partial [Flavisolibacter sp.]